MEYMYFDGSKKMSNMETTEKEKLHIKNCPFSYMRYTVVQVSPDVSVQELVGTSKKKKRN